MVEFVKWPKIVRWENRRPLIFTEKIDGTNACVVITEDGEFACQSRTRIITPETDNFGFATWAYSHKEALIEILGPGYHFGEWWGAGIQRTYGLKHKKFSVFNTRKWGPHNPPPKIFDSEGRYDYLFDVVPLLPVTSAEEAKEFLRSNGSLAVPGWMRPEGAVALDLDSDTRFKIIIDKPEGAR